MKKLLSMLLIVTMVVGLAACGSSDSKKKTKVSENDVALITDVGTIDDESFNQATWQGVKQYCKENGYKCDYKKPTEDSTDARVAAIMQACGEGYKTIVLPGYLFGDAITQVQDSFPNVKFVAIDVAKGDLNGKKINDNVVCFTFAEEQAGFLAGYSAVKDGYTKLGFLGGIEVPSVVRYGYGYIQGAKTAATEMNTKVNIKYTYGGQFSADDKITAKMQGWYADGTEIVFACGGGIWGSPLEACPEYNGKLIGVDVDQVSKGKAVEKKNGYNPFVTSAMKGLQNTTVSVLNDIKDGKWDKYAGKIMHYSLADGDYVGLPTDDGSWNFKTFTKDDYEAIKTKIKDGSIKIDDNSKVDIAGLSDNNVSVELIK
ncbi:basic membrane protein A [Lachnospiraceae bacterium C7]|nr:basic membrane protein A [Lachnospiraceae bacterium C7]